MDALQKSTVVSVLSCDVMNSNVPLDSTAPPSTKMNVQMYAKTLTIWRDTSMQVWSAIDPVMTTGGGFLKTSQGVSFCAGCCLQYK
jgi:hypothetical protein